MPAAVRQFRPAARWAAWSEGPTTTGPAAASRWTAPGRARALFATSMKTANCASVSSRRWRFGVHRFRNRMIAQHSLVLPRRRCRRQSGGRWRKGSGTAGLLGGREAATGGVGIPRRGDRKHRPHHGLPARFRHASAEPPRDVLQLPDRHPEPEHDRAGADADHAGDDQRVAGTEFLDRNSEAIASRPAKTRPIPATNITNIIELTPQPRPKRSQAARRHDTVILCAPPTANCMRVPQ